MKEEDIEKKRKGKKQGKYYPGKDEGIENEIKKGKKIIYFWKGEEDIQRKRKRKLCREGGERSGPSGLVRQTIEVKDQGETVWIPNAASWRQKRESGLKSEAPTPHKASNPLRWSMTR